VNETLVIENPNDNEVTIEVMNLLGELILKTKTSTLVDLSSLKTGFYTLRINGFNYTIIKD
jgi:hypothetical protein